MRMVSSFSQVHFLVVLVLWSFSRVVDHNLWWSSLECGWCGLVFPTYASAYRRPHSRWVRTGCLWVLWLIMFVSLFLDCSCFLRVVTHGGQWWDGEEIVLMRSVLFGFGGNGLVVVLMVANHKLLADFFPALVQRFEPWAHVYLSRGKSQVYFHGFVLLWNGSEWFFVLFLSIEITSISVMTVNASLLMILCWCLGSGRKQSQTMIWKCCVFTFFWLLAPGLKLWEDILVPYCEAMASADVTFYTSLFMCVSQFSFTGSLLVFSMWRIFFPLCNSFLFFSIGELKQTHLILL